MGNENGDVTQQTPQDNQPSTLEEALKRLREGNAQTTETNVDSGSVEEAGVSNAEPGSDASGQIKQGGNGAIQQAQQQGEAGGQENGLAPDGTQPADSGQLGGLEPPALATAQQADVDIQTEPTYQETDYNGVMEQLAKSVARQAAIDTNKLFADQGVSKITIGDLYQQDTNSGRVTFNNPDDPNHPFASRQEAQAWVNAFNQEYEAQWKQQAMAIQQRYMQDTAPAMRLMQFAPVYDQMNEQTQQVFDTIIEPYSVKDSSGMVIGFSCDLNAAKAQAEKLAGMFSGGTAQAQAQQNGQTSVQPVASGPALDATTHGSDSSGKPEEPKNLNEAMKMLNQKKKETKNNGK